MLLAVSVGNSHIAFGVHDGSAWTRRWRIQTVQDTSDESARDPAGHLWNSR